MNTNFEKNQAIMAAAGCGKTEELAMRYIKLLEAGAKPESILALTFTRLAAGEMLDRVIDRLSEAVLSDKKKEDLIKQLWGDGKSDVDFSKLLKLIIENLNCLRLKTLDSFFIELVKCFAPELDVDLNLQLTDDFSNSVLETKAIDKIYSSARKDKDYYKELKKVFDKITQDNKESNVERKFKKGIENGYELFLRTKKEAWENFSMPDIDTSDENWTAIVDEFENCDSFKPLLNREKNSSYINYLEKFKSRNFIKITETGPIKKLLDADNQKNMNYGAKPNIWDLNDETNKDNLILKKIIDYIFAYELKKVIPATKSYYNFLYEFDKKYKQIKYDSGLITFSDVCRILNNDDSIFTESGKMEMYFRLDATIKHLLIDEFQDTSWEQWQAIFPIAEEIISDTSGDRSFFIVGDIKQAIYSWRGGDYELFNKIIDYYKNIKNDSLEKSWRSGNNILNPINKIFCFEDDKIKKWSEKSKFKKHVSAVDKYNPGYTEVRYVEAEKIDNKKVHASDQIVVKQEAVISLLKKIKPWERGLKTAIIFKSNNLLNNWNTELKNSGIPCCSQGKSRLLDNIAVQAVLALFKWMETPEDKLVEFHVLNSFLSEVVKNKEKLFELKSFLFYNSYSKFIEKIIAKIKKSVDKTTRARLNQLIETAEQFQPNSSTCPTDFISYVEKIYKKEPPTSQGVVLVTMHSSKGMTYDMVILPDMDRSLSINSENIFLENINKFDKELKQPETQSIILKPSSKISKIDPLLNSMFETTKEKAEHEFYNIMYVALTRAAKALYIIRAPGRGKTFSDLINLALECKGDIITPIAKLEDIPGVIDFQKGCPLWFENEKIISKSKENKTVSEFVKKAKFDKVSERRRQYITPSTVKQNKTDKKIILPKFFKQKSNAAERGTIIHELFATIEWLEPENLKSNTELLKISKRVSKTFSEKELLEIIDDFSNILKKDEIKFALEKTNENSEVFLEKSFAAITDGNSKLVRGIFDRVIFFPNSTNPEKIVLYDFKTDAINSEIEISNSVEKYLPQMKIYTNALKQAYNISEDKISKFLVFTSPGIVKKC